MANTLPQAADYGARTSVSTNRVDMPGTGDVATGEALVRASQQFTQVIGERKEKKDRLNYSLAKNELLQADIANREKLKGDEDYKTYDQRYSDGYNTTRDEIYAKYELTADDGAILNAESDVIRERGRVQVGDASRVVKRDNEQAAILGNLDVAREQILSLDPQSANDMMLTQLDMIQAAVEAGVYTDVEGLAQSQTFVKDVATARLISMDVEDRITALEQSLTKRKLDGAISIEDIRANKGTGSVADFIPRDTAQKMLDLATEENEGEIVLREAYSLIDRADELFPGETEAARKKKMAYIKANASSAEIREQAVSKATGQFNEERRVETGIASDIVSSATDLMRSGVPNATEPGKTDSYSHQDIPRSEWVKLSAGQKAALIDYDKLRRQNKEFGDIDVLTVQPGRKSVAGWYNLSPQEQADEDLDSAEWYVQLTGPKWNFLKAQQKDIQDRIASAKPPALDTGQTNQQMVTTTMDILGIPDKELRSKAWIEFDMAAQEAQEEKGSKLTNDERRLVLSEILKPMVFAERNTFSTDYKNPKHAVLLTPEQKQKAFLPWADATGHNVAMNDGSVMSAAKKIENIAMRLDGVDWDNVSQDNRERAYYALVVLEDIEEVKSRLKGE